MWILLLGTCVKEPPSQRSGMGVSRIPVGARGKDLRPRREQGGRDRPFLEEPANWEGPMRGWRRMNAGYPVLHASVKSSTPFREEHLPATSGGLPRPSHDDPRAFRQPRADPTLATSAAGDLVRSHDSMADCSPCIGCRAGRAEVHRSPPALPRWPLLRMSQVFLGSWSEACSTHPYPLWSGPVYLPSLPESIGSTRQSAPDS